MIFVDSNIPMYVAGREHPNRGPALRLLGRARSRQIVLCTSTEVLQEILYRYVGLDRLDLATEVYDLFVQQCEVVLPVTLGDMDHARTILLDTPLASVRCAVHAAVMLQNGITDIASFDQGFDRIAGVTRVDLP